jgi:predicted ATPase with chaperone activity
MSAVMLESVATDAPSASPQMPLAPRSVAATGLPETFLVELAAKAIYLKGTAHLSELTQQLRLPAVALEELLGFMRTERIVELTRRGTIQGDVSFTLTEAGRARAAEALRKSYYTGAAPVAFDAYVEQVHRQSIGHLQVTREALDAAYQGMIVGESLREKIGAAMNSGRPMFLYGPAGSGKSYLAASLTRLMAGTVAIPYAFLVGGEVVQVFDPQVHRRVDAEARPSGVDGKARTDERWVNCTRPVIVTGGELRLEMLDLRLDPSNGFYQAPPHLKANNGLFIVDDLGRQLVTPEQLMNRWIVPMDRQTDCLSLHTGTTFELPFDLVLVFATNLAPHQVADEAFLRRIGYKIHVGPVDEHDYAEILKAVCSEFGVRYEADGAETLMALHRRLERPTLACYPRDLAGMIRDYATYYGKAPELTPGTVIWAWHNYFTAN